ncbi:MAG: phosphoribosylformylglycinamidine cyclo-ligase [Puniceicoccales bacterium]|jgi:phosphoribosylformylglycinamidine cyclo-ligase|nr:phosphoribosylformylglycinamidine cyclo-ligase [Puniceicoccales bacterium]
MSALVTDSGRYAARGVSASKHEVHAAVDRLDRGLFPGAFCKLTPDHLTGDPALCNVTHGDGAGTKSLLAYLWWRETGDASVFRGIAQDSIVMNLDDLLCVGVTGRILFSNTINRNARNVPGEVLAELINGTEDFLALLRSHGVDAHGGGGETADVGDLTPTLTVDSCATAVLARSSVVDASRIAPGLAIVGLASGGPAASYEIGGENSGIGSNGLTSARHELLCRHYAEKYPETRDPRTAEDLVYCGPFRLGDRLAGSPLSVGQALLSPTRTYAPVVLRLLREFGPGRIRGLIHCSGGAQTKCLRFGTNVHFIKDNLMPVPPVFREIQAASGTDAHEMHRVYNMGHRMEVYCSVGDAGGVVSVADSFGIKAQVIGRTECSTLRGGKGNHLTLVPASGERLVYGAAGA